ncbi:MAG TPA: bifunctional 5,10-methylenetetrahydrofolate dehydrogenase/5,10-methenyltetrahydrofolate cyclohydrolase [Candidatus Saccharimonadales bacterium]|nr:bifunctional 5,10-methylenetetrahydrofolate dehydrogenase/5,10-methenyltetrahydrofolate cyclohydrolase [Candidatus Saccharimonadales bacterium]
MKILNGSEIAGFIKERQAHQVRSLRQAHGIFPKLAIVVTVKNPVIETYMRLKQHYGEDILVDVEVHRIDQAAIAETLNMLSNDEAVHGIIIQLPLENPSETDKIVRMVPPEKDVDALGSDANFEPATPMAIMWLLAGYNVDLAGKRVLLIGHGKLVGIPLEKLLKETGVDVHVADRQTTDLAGEVAQADVIITATGSPAVLTADMIKQDAVVVDAGVASEEGRTVGDLAEDVYGRDDLTLTPKKGGVGPLTVCALFENVIRAASAAAKQKET